MAESLVLMFEFWYIERGQFEIYDLFTRPWQSILLFLTNIWIKKINYLYTILIFVKSVFFFITQSLLAPFKSFLLNRAVRSRSVKEMRWLTGITGYTLMGMVRQFWLAVKVRHVRASSYEPCNRVGSVTGTNSVVCSYGKFQPGRPGWIQETQPKWWNIYRLLHRKYFVRIFIHSLQDFGKLTRSLRSLVRFPKSCNS